MWPGKPTGRLLPPPLAGRRFARGTRQRRAPPICMESAGCHLSTSLLGQDKRVALCLTRGPEVLSPLPALSVPPNLLFLILALFFAWHYLSLQNEQSNKLFTQGHCSTGRIHAKFCTAWPQSRSCLLNLGGLGEGWGSKNFCPVNRGWGLGTGEETLKTGTIPNEEKPFTHRGAPPP